MMDVILFIYRSLALAAPLGIFSCFIVMFLAMFLWMRAVPSTLRVHAPLVDDRVRFDIKRRPEVRPPHNVSWVSRA